jgi:hypothetical protein
MKKCNISLKGKYSVFTGLSGLKVTGYDIKPGIANYISIV